MSGENPLVTTLSKRAGTDSTPMMDDEDAIDDGMGAADMRPVRQGGRRGGGRANPLATPARNLSGLPQMIGLALGAPEFQRR